MLSGKAYNFQYAWNPGGAFSPPPGAAVWIECVSASPGLEVYDGPGNKMENPPRPYTPIFGTAGSSTQWPWYGRMAHNSYAILNPTNNVVTAEYRVYFGDAQTGAPDAYSSYGDATVVLTWNVALNSSQAGSTIDSLARQGAAAQVSFRGELGKTFYLERSPVLGPAAAWQTVAGPLAGSDGPQTLDRLQRQRQPGVLSAARHPAVKGRIMKTSRRLLVPILICVLARGTLFAQTYVTPMMGGGQVAADMAHIDIFYDADANQLHAQVDDSGGTPKLRPLEPGYAFGLQQPYAMLEGKAYNAQYGWNVGGFFTIPPGTAIWIEPTVCSPGLETYEGWGRLGNYAPIFGTADSPRLWKWSGVMMHNTYAVRNPATDRLFAEYHIYFGDADTGSRTQFMNLDDTTVRLEWTVDPVEDPMTFKFGATGQTNGAPLSFVNAAQFATDSRFVLNLHQTNGGPRALRYEGSISMVVLPASVPNGGPCRQSCRARLAPGAADRFLHRAAPGQSQFLGTGPIPAALPRARRREYGDKLLPPQ